MASVTVLPEMAGTRTGRTAQSAQHAAPMWWLLAGALCGALSGCISGGVIYFLGSLLPASGAWYVVGLTSKAFGLFAPVLGAGVVTFFAAAGALDEPAPVLPIEPSAVYRRRRANDQLRRRLSPLQPAIVAFYGRSPDSGMALDPSRGDLREGWFTAWCANR